MSEIAAVVPVREFSDDRFLLFCTRKGVVKKTALSAYGNVRTVGLNAINIREGDELIDVQITDGDDEVILASRRGRRSASTRQDARTRLQKRGRESVQGTKSCSYAQREAQRERTVKLVSLDEGVASWMPSRRERGRRRAGSRAADHPVNGVMSRATTAGGRPGTDPGERVRGSGSGSCPSTKCRGRASGGCRDPDAPARVAPAGRGTRR
jgi:DNA gyrase/topoisomerase IV subunit A